MHPASPGSLPGRRPVRLGASALALLLAIGLLGAASLGVAQAAVATPVPLGTAPPRPVVSGNQLLDSRTGQPLRVAGVNRSGSEYACAQGWGLFDGPVDDAALAAITRWGTNTVRVPLNESCWLGRNGAPAQYAGATYRSAIVGLVDRLHARGQAVILDLHWSAAGSELATKQSIAPGHHTPELWRSVAGTFRDDPSVMFELFNEPREISWPCWRDGCTTHQGWQSVGMQQLVDAVRATGARQPIILGGLNWAGDLRGWAQHAPQDPQRALVAGWHIYDFSECSSQACWEDTAGRLVQTHPVLLTEVGQSGCSTSFIDRMLPWADAHGIGYVGWAWNTASCADGPSLISDYSGTPTAFGEGFRRHLARARSSTPTPVPPTAPVPGGPVRAVDPQTVFDFESGAQGWTTRWGQASTRPWTGTGATGRGALGVAVDGVGYPAVGVETAGALASRLQGAEVSMRVWVPADATGRAPVTVSPVALDGTWRAVVAAPQQLVPDSWHTVSFTAPRAGVRMVGLQVNSATAWRGTVYLDDVRIGTAVRAGFDATTDGWAPYWGPVSSFRRTTGTFAGAGALGVRLSAPGYPAVATTGTAGLFPGMRVTVQVHSPRADAPQVRPIVLDGGFRPTSLAPHDLRQGWNTISFTVPTTLAEVRVLAVQIENGRGWRGDLALDSVVW